MRGKTYEYDAFISHAVEDKIGIANELCERLEAAGLKVWYSGAELSMGDSIENSIREGLASSRFGIIILSHHYIFKSWPLQELAIFRELEHTRGKGIILPILHQITIGEVATRIPTIVDRFAISSDKGMDSIVKSIVEKVRTPAEKDWWINFIPKRGFMSVAVLVVVLGLSGTYGFIQWGYAGPSDAIIEASIQNRIGDLQRRVSGNLNQELASGAKQVVRASIDTLYTGFLGVKSRLHNDYEFRDGFGVTRSKAKVAETLALDVGALSPFNNYDLNRPATYLFRKYSNNQLSKARYTFINDASPGYRVEDEDRRDDQYRVTVAYTNNIKCVSVELIFPQTSDGIRYRTVYLYGTAPYETFVFFNDNGTWKLLTVE